MIELQEVSKIYTEGDESTRALTDITFTIKQGEFVSIMGPSGSGKSTLLHILSLFDRATSGIYKFQGKDVSGFNDTELAKIRNKDMGFVFQSFNLLGRSSVYENVELPLLYTTDIAVSKRSGAVKKAIHEVGLEDKTYIEAGKLSGGQKQRVAIARALVNNPNIIFADEPTGNLDSKSGAQIMEILEKLNYAGRTIILVTHETYTAEFAHRLIKLKDGKIESDSPFIKKHRHAEFFK